MAIMIDFWEFFQSAGRALVDDLKAVAEDTPFLFFIVTPVVSIR